MFKATIFIVGALMLNGVTWADEITDSALETSARFLKAKPEVKDWTAEPGSYVDAWERISGLKTMVWLRHDGALPIKWRPTLNRRISALRRLPIYMVDNEDMRSLGETIRLFAEYADLYLMGAIKYGDYLPVDNFAVSHGQRFAIALRSKPYAENNCKWGEQCPPTPEVWEQ